jgi:lysylphosphatidylglycerol synthetase-like protein (DUF2156 family)
VSIVRRYPFTSVVVVLVVIASMSETVLRVVERRMHRPADGFASIGLLRPFGVVAASNGIIALVVTVAAVVVLVGGSERLLGWRRTALAFVATTVVGTVVGALASFVDADGRNLLALVLGRATSFDPWTAIVGTVMTASAFAGALWRRRIRVNTVAAVAVMLLYSGHAAQLYAVVAAAAGFGLGELLHRRPKRQGWVRSSYRETRVLLATVVLVSAVGPVIALVSRGRVGLLAPLGIALAGGSAGGAVPSCSLGGVTDLCARDLSDFQVRGLFALVLAVMPLLVLAVGGVGLFRGSRFALWLVVVVDVVTGLSAAVFYDVVPHRQVTAPGTRLADDHLALSLSLAVSVLVPLVTAAALVTRRTAFSGRPSRRSVIGFGIVVSGAGLLLVAAVVLVASAGHAVRDPLRLALTVLGPIAPVTLPAQTAHLDPFLRTVVGLAGPLLWLVVAVAAIRPSLAPGGPGAVGDRVGRNGPGARARARALLRDGGGDTFGWMTTWSGNSYWFDEDGRAAVAYRLSGRVAITVGGPFGEPADRSAAMTGFARFCDDAGWVPVFYGIEASVAEPLRRLGWDTLAVAEDADLDPRTWTTSGKRKQDVRTSVNRAAREGITALWAPWSALPTAVVRQIEAISEEWLADRELPEMGFTLGGVDEMRDPEVRTLVALDAGGTVLAVTSWLPSFRDDRVVGWTLDVMRRRSDAPNGVMEFLVASAADRMRADGIERLSLSAAPLAASVTGPDERATDPNAISSLLELVGGVLEPVYGFRSLLRFKAKFGPELHPLVMAYPDPVALPAIGIAIVRTYLPDLSVRQAVSLVRSRPETA